MTDCIEPSTETVEVSRDLGELADLRVWLAERLDDVVVDHDEVVAEIVLMATELAANAVMHTDSSPTLSFAVLPEHVRVAVHDDDPEPPVLEPPDLTRPHGNGLRIVDAWADRWGSDPVDVGKDVWFTARRW